VDNWDSNIAGKSDVFMATKKTASSHFRLNASNYNYIRVRTGKFAALYFINSATFALVFTVCNLINCVINNEQ